MITKKNPDLFNFISFIFNPENVIPLLLIILAFKSFSGASLYGWIFMIVVFNYLFNYIWLYYLSFLGVEVDKPLEKGSVKKDRLLALIPQILVLGLEMVISDLYGQQQPFHAGIVLFLIGGILFSLVTYYWKISTHAATTASLFTALTVIISFWYLFIFLLVPIIYVSRKKLYRHTDYQLIMGNLLGIIVTLVILDWYGLVIAKV